MNRCYTNYTNIGKFISNINGNWRNSIYTSCRVCKYEKKNCCDDILVSFEEYQDPTLVHDFPLFQCDRDETGDAIRKICSFFWHCIWREKNVKTIPVY